MPSKHALVSGQSAESISAATKVAKKKYDDIVARLDLASKVDRLERVIAEREAVLNQLRLQIEESEAEASALLENAEQQKNEYLSEAKRIASLEMKTVEEEAQKLQAAWASFDAERTAKQKELSEREAFCSEEERRLYEWRDSLDSRKARLMADEEANRVYAIDNLNAKKAIDDQKKDLERKELANKEIRMALDERFGAAEMVESEADEKMRIASSKLDEASESLRFANSIIDEAEKKSKQSTLIAKEIEKISVERQAETARLNQIKRDLLSEQGKLKYLEDAHNERESRILQRESRVMMQEKAIEKARDDIRKQWGMIEDAKRKLESKRL